MNVMVIGGKDLADTQLSVVNGFLLRGHEVTHVPSRKIFNEGGHGEVWNVILEAGSRECDIALIWMPNVDITPDIVERMKQHGTKTVFFTIDVTGDPPNAAREAARKACDFAIGTTLTQVKGWEAEGQQAAYFPPPYDIMPGRYNFSTKPFDCVAFAAGNCYTMQAWPEMYAARADMAKAIIDAGLPFEAYGRWNEARSGWGKNGGMMDQSHYGGWIPHDMLPDLYRSSAVNLDSHVRPTEEHYLNERLIMCMGAGGFMLCDRVAGIEEDLKDGEHLALWSTLEELVEKAKYYLEHPEECARIAQRGQSVILRKYNCMEFARSVERL